jgi:hypothetical protein
LNEVQEACGGVDDVIEVSKKVNSFGSDGEAKVSIGVDDGDGDFIEDELDRRTFNAKDTTLGDVEDHTVLVGPTFGDTEEDSGGGKVWREEGSIIGVK